MTYTFKTTEELAQHIAGYVRVRAGSRAEEDNLHHTAFKLGYKAVLDRELSEAEVNLKESLKKTEVAEADHKAKIKEHCKLLEAGSRNKQAIEEAKMVVFLAAIQLRYVKAIQAAAEANVKRAKEAYKDYKNYISTDPTNK